MVVVFRGWVLRNKGSGKDASLVSMEIVQDAEYRGARYFREFKRE
jgi:hypothetical protein